MINEKVALIKGKNYAPKNLGRTCVVGLGKTGAIVADYLCRLIGTRVESVHIYAGEKKEFAMKTADKLLKAGATVSFDDDIIDNVYDLCIISPGISKFSELFLSAKKNCGELISEIEFAWREANKDAKWIAITGTNGKTSTTLLTEHILKTAGKNAVAVGNVGNVALSEVEYDEKKSIYRHNDYYVVEVSSYQLATVDKFSPEVSILINITPDHISWHKTFDDYRDSKLKIFDNCNYAVLNVDDQEACDAVNYVTNKISNSHIIKNTYNEKEICFDIDGVFHNVLNIEELNILGEHNCVNARAAASACSAIGLSDKQISNGLKTFMPLEHRLEPCGIVAGVRLFNDSKATNVDAVLVALKSFEKGKAIFMLGGKDKNTDLHILVEKCFEKLKGVVIYGAAKDRFLAAFEKYKENNPKYEEFIIEKAENMKEAFKISMENAFPGDFVVLSPACSSFDEFNSFEHRGEVFKKLVSECKK